MEEFQKNGILVAELYCAPEDSQFFWKKMSFFYFPDLKQNDKKIRMYRPLVQTLEPNNQIISNDVIELWDDHTGIADRKKPTWTWNVTEGKLEKPIILPVNVKWQICIKSNNKIIEKSTVCRCSLMKDNFTDFLIIEST